MIPIYDTKSYINKAQRIHIDEFNKSLYDYSKTIYAGSKNKIIVVCPIHGEFKILAGSHISKAKSRNNFSGCPKCGMKRSFIHSLHNTEHFIIKAKLKHGNKYDYSKSVYKNSRSKIIVVCPIHGEFKILANDHTRKNSPGNCPKCNTHNKLKIDEIIKKANILYNNKYNYSKSVYKNIFTRIIIICPKHGEFTQTPHNHLRGHQCLKCLKSNGEKTIIKYLEINHINYINEQTFPGLIGIGGGLLRFDFYLPDHNICIEFDGPQHFNRKISNQMSRQVSNYDKLKIHDHKKSKYCKKHSIKLIRIPYYRYNKIKEILNESKIYG